MNKKLVTIMALLVAAVSIASASVVNLGSASGFVVLTYNSDNVSDSAFNGGEIGVVNGNWTQSGGGQTNNQQPAQVDLTPGHTNSGPAVLTTVFNQPPLAQAWTDAQNASAALASLTPTQTLGVVTTGQTITESAVGHYVLAITSISLNQSALTLSAPVGSTFVLNIAGNVTLTGGGAGGILVAGGLKVSDVAINLTSPAAALVTTGGGNAQVLDGIVLATGSAATVSLDPGQINGQLFATSFKTSSGALVVTMPVVPEVTPSSVIFGFLGLVIVCADIARRQKKAIKMKKFIAKLYLTILASAVVGFMIAKMPPDAWIFGGAMIGLTAIGFGVCWSLDVLDDGGPFRDPETYR